MNLIESEITSLKSILLTILVILVQLASFVNADSYDCSNTGQIVYESWISKSVKDKFLDFQIEEVSQYAEQVRIFRNRIDFLSKYEEVIMKEHEKEQTIISHKFSFPDKNLLVTVTNQERTCKMDRLGPHSYRKHGNDWLKPEWLPKAKKDEQQFVGPFVIFSLLEHPRTLVPIRGRQVQRTRGDKPVYEFSVCPTSNWKFVFKFVENDARNKVIQQVLRFKVSKNDKEDIFNTYNIFEWKVRDESELLTFLPVGYDCGQVAKRDKPLTDYGQQATICFDYVYNYDPSFLLSDEHFSSVQTWSGENEYRSACIGFDRKHEYAMSWIKYYDRTSKSIQPRENGQLVDLKTGQSYRFHYRFGCLSDGIFRDKLSQHKIKFTDPLSVFTNFEQVFHLTDEKAKYLGTRTVRDRLCDVYEQSVNLKNEDIQEMSTFIITHYYPRGLGIAPFAYSVPLQIQVDRFDMKNRLIRQGKKSPTDH